MPGQPKAHMDDILKVIEPIHNDAGKAVLKPGYVWVDSARDLDGAIKFACEREGLSEPWNSVETLNRLRSLPAYCEIVTSPVLRSLWEARLVKKDRGFV